jgi:predicted RNase H-like HicB family nuclease
MKEHYAILIEWSDKDQRYIASLPDWGSLICTDGATYEEALEKAKELIDLLIEVRTDAGEPIPAPKGFAA